MIDILCGYSLLRIFRNEFSLQFPACFAGSVPSGFPLRSDDVPVVELPAGSVPTGFLSPAAQPRGTSFAAGILPVRKRNG